MNPVLHLLLTEQCYHHQHHWPLLANLCISAVLLHLAVKGLINHHLPEHPLLAHSSLVPGDETFHHLAAVTNLTPTNTVQIPLNCVNDITWGLGRSRRGRITRI